MQKYKGQSQYQIKWQYFPKRIRFWICSWDYLKVVLVCSTTFFISLCTPAFLCCFFPSLFFT